MRDLNGCRTGTANIENGLSIDIFAAPLHCPSKGNDWDLWEEYVQSCKDRTDPLAWHGIPVPTPAETVIDRMLNAKFDGWREQPSPWRNNEIEGITDPNRACANRGQVRYKQPAVDEGGLRLRRKGWRLQGA